MEVKSVMDSQEPVRLDLNVFEMSDLQRQPVGGSSEYCVSAVTLPIVACRPDVTKYALAGACSFRKRSPPR